MRPLKNILAIPSVIFLLTLSLPGFTTNFKLDKTRIVMDETTKREEIRIYNEADFLQSFKVSLIEMKMNDEGALQRVESYEHSAQPYLRIGPRISRDVKPYSFQKVRIIKRGKPKNGEYRSHLMVEALTQVKTDQESGIFVRPNFKYIIPIFVVQGKEQSELSLGEPQATEDGNLRLVLKRAGEGSVSGNLVITDKNNEELYRANQVSVYPEIASRTIETSLVFNELKGRPISVQFHDPSNDDEIVMQQVLTL